MSARLQISNTVLPSAPGLAAAAASGEQPGVAQPKSRFAVGLGITTLVTIMVVVLLTTFAVLALVSARADLKLSQMGMDSARQYYAADAAAQRWLSEQVAANEPASANEPVSATAPNTAPATATATSRILSESFAIDTNRQLVVQVELAPDGEITILQWQTQTTQTTQTAQTTQTQTTQATETTQGGEQ
ncbi:MAG: hypothetical protein LBR39_05820 [Coriobacteriales bacterium]|jgi:hypothetical protein|nr:hypothetical protein [Coriobacteriales bacterium]